jgi:hypothetical protein
MATDSLGQPNTGTDNHTVSVDGTCSSGCGTSAVVNLAHIFPDDVGFDLTPDGQYFDSVLRTQGVGDHEFRQGEDASYDEEVTFQDVTLEILPSPGEARGDPILLRFVTVVPAPLPGQTVHSVLSVGVNGQQISLDNNVAPPGETGENMHARIGDTITIDGKLTAKASIHGPAEFYGGGGFETVLVLGKETSPDVAATSLTWNTAQGGVDYGYTISVADLPQATTVDLDWATGTTTDTVIGSPKISMPTQTAQGTYHLHASPSQLGTPPAGAKYLLEVVDPGNLISPAERSKVASWRSDLSGLAWLMAAGVSQNHDQGTYPFSTSVSTLSQTFEPRVVSFMHALEHATPAVKPTIITTYRSPGRAYLMHYSWEIFKKGMDPKAVDALNNAPPGIDIRWNYGDPTLSKQAAQQMYQFFGSPPVAAYPSNHSGGNAIDMVITWKGNLTVIDGNGVKRTIKSGPHNSTNPTLIQIGATFGVIHFYPPNKDRNHWSINGR